MQIEKDKVVSLSYTLTNSAGEVVDTATDADPLFYLHGAGNLLDSVEAELDGKSMGDSLRFTLAPEQAYGEHRADGVRSVERKLFPTDMPLSPGVPFFVDTEDGKTIQAFVKAVDGDSVTVDFNHPLAGQTLTFNIKVLQVRDATDGELAHGHVHGPGGHHHH